MLTLLQTSVASFLVTNSADSVYYPDGEATWGTLQPPTQWLKIEHIGMFRSGYFLAIYTFHAHLVAGFRPKWKHDYVPVRCFRLPQNLDVPEFLYLQFRALTTWKDQGLPVNAVLPHCMFPLPWYHSCSCSPRLDASQQSLAARGLR